jgi:hypothetical protein
MEMRKKNTDLFLSDAYLVKYTTADAKLLIPKWVIYDERNLNSIALSLRKKPCLVNHEVSC